MSTITAGIIDRLLNTLKSLSDFIKRELDDLSRAGLDTSEPKKTDKGGVKFHIKSKSGNEADIEYVPLNDEGTEVDILIVNKSENLNETISKVKADKAKSVLVDYLKELWGDELDEDNDSANSAKRLEVELTRITSSESCTVNMSKIYATYAPNNALADLDTVLGDDAFIDSLPEGEIQSFVITQDDTNFDVNPISDVDTCRFDVLVCQGYMLQVTLQSLHWNVKGEGSPHLHNLFGEYAHKASWMVDIFAEISVEYCGHVKHPAYEVQFPAVLDTTSIDAQSAIQIAMDAINSYVEALECYSVNYSADVQGEIERFIREWKHESNYTLANVLH